MPDEPHARLRPPVTTLRSGVFLAAERDTRGVELGAAQRFNYYPASPFPMISWIFEGQLQLVEDPDGGSVPVLGPVLAPVVFSGPHRRPSASWSLGPVYAISVTFSPDVLAAALGIRIDSYLERTVSLGEVASGPLVDRLLALDASSGGRAFLQRVEEIVAASGHMPGEGQLVPTVRSWLHTMAVRAAFTRGGAGARQAQRRIKAWTGQSHRELQLYARLEEAFAHLATLPPSAPLDLADVAASVGYADQSHLGREVRRVTGVSPGRLEALIRSDESFWMYRLLRSHLQNRRAVGCESVEVAVP